MRCRWTGSPNRFWPAPGGDLAGGRGGFRTVGPSTGGHGAGVSGGILPRASSWRHGGSVIEAGEGGGLGGGKSSKGMRGAAENGKKRAAAKTPNAPVHRGPERVRAAAA